jgi:hypothetical protein
MDSLFELAALKRFDAVSGDRAQSAGDEDDAVTLKGRAYTRAENRRGDLDQALPAKPAT